MNNEPIQKKAQQGGQSLIIVAVSMIVLLIFASIAVDMTSAYAQRRTDQNAADAAALAGLRELSRQLNLYGHTIGLYGSETTIRQAMNEFAELNGAPDSDGIAGNAINTHVTGYYLGADGNRVSELPIGSTNIVHPNARGIEALIQTTAPSFFSGIVGLDGIPVDAEAAVLLQGGVCTAGCLAPIATLTTTFEFGQCYNIFDGPNAGAAEHGGAQESLFCSQDSSYACQEDSHCDLGTCKSNGRCTNDAQVYCSSNADCNLGTCVASGGEAGGSGGAGGFGWLNWSWQGEGHSCKDVGEPDDCSAPCTEYNLTPMTCLSGNVHVGDWVGSTAGLKTTPPKLGAGLDAYIDTDTPITVIIYDTYQGTGCANMANDVKKGLAYHVVGFAKFKITGYQLPRGVGTAVMRDTLDPATCVDWGAEGNRITGVFLEWVEGDGGGDCNYFGMSGPVMVK